MGWMQWRMNWDGQLTVGGVEVGWGARWMVREGFDDYHNMIAAYRRQYFAKPELNIIFLGCLAMVYLCWYPRVIVSIHAK